MNDKSNLSLQNFMKDKLNCLREMLEFTKRQSSAIENEEIELLDNLIYEKNTLISQINLLDSKFKEVLGDNEISEQTLLEVLSQINDTLKEIKIVDDQNNQKLNTAINDMKSNLKDVRCGQRAIKNYGNADPYKSFVSQGGTLFIDQDS